MQNTLCPTCQSPIAADAPGGICPACALLGVANPTSPTQAAAASVPTLDELGAAFPELEVLEMCGQGGMGVVFKARQPKLDRLVALKILTPALAAQPGFSERFTREARALAKLSHPNIVGVHDFGESGGFFYLIMEFVDGVNLRQAIRAGISPEQALLLVPRVCEALQFAHDHGVLHRDIKPENILLDSRGNPKLADFGIAKIGNDQATGLTLSGAQLGTAAYMAPEQIEHPSTVDHRADIYSLGVVLYEMLTGELPLGRFAAPSEKTPVGTGVDDVVLRALEKQRERRQQSATEMKTEVEHLSSGGAPAAATTPTQGVPLSQPAVSGTSLSLMAVLFGFQSIGVGIIFGVLGTVLGWIAVSEFRRKPGQMRGAGFAVFAAMFVPTVVVLFPLFIFSGFATTAIMSGADSAVLGIVVVLLFLGGIAAASWAAWKLWKSVASSVVGAEPRQQERPAGSAVPVPPVRRVVPFSKAAVAGAFLSISSIPFGLVVFLIVKTILNPSLESGSQLNGPVAGNIIIFGFVPALIGVALGWKAVGDFRYHRGHLRGGGTAVFAALGIPVLAVIVTALANFEDIDRAISPSRRNPEGAIVACFVVLAAIAASIWAVRALWKFVHHGPPGVPVDAAPSVSWPRHLPWLVFALTFIPGLVFGLVMIFSQMHAAKSRNRAQQNEAPATTADAYEPLNPGAGYKKLEPGAGYEMLESAADTPEYREVMKELAKAEKELAALERDLAKLRKEFREDQSAVVGQKDRIALTTEQIQVLKQRAASLLHELGMERP
jgi:tRNA A-37 threonylcarbamoyl transferase component Bud32